MPYSAAIIRAAEETKARTVEISGQSDNSDSPAYESMSYRRQKADVELIQKVYGGTKTMRAAGKEFLKPHPMEKNWEDRRDQAVAFNALKKTVGGMNGMIFRTDPSYSEDMEEVLRGTETEDGDLDNIDLQGRAFPVFWRHVADLALRDGHAWVHVEAPRRDDQTIRTEADEDQAGVRPYWIALEKHQVINWRAEIRAGRPVLTLIAYRESSTEPDGDFGEVQRTRIRVLREASVRETEDDDAERRIVGELWEFRKKGEDARGRPADKTVDRWVRIEFYALDPRIREIPVKAVYAERAGSFESTPPLLDLAYEQIEHYRVRSERQKSMTFSSISVPYALGREVTDDEGNAKVRWGSDGMLLLNDPEASVGVIESRGYGLDATKDELQEIEARMARLGLQMLVDSTGTQPRTATAEIFEKSESDAWLALFATNLQDTANECLGIHATYRGIEEPGKITLSDDFTAQLISAQMLSALDQITATGHLSVFTLWEIMKRGGILPDAFSEAEEIERLARQEAVRLDAVSREMFGDDEGPDEPDERDMAA